MRRILITLVAIVCNIVAIAQNHLEFKGIPMDGTCESFAKKLVAKGFSLESNSDSTYFLSGTFTNEKVNIGLLGTPKTNKICRIMVFYDKKSDWYRLKNQYSKLKDNNASKYTLDKDYSFFIDPYYEGDGFEMTAVKSDKCRYTSFFNAIGGHIIVEISELSCITIAYEDTENTELEKAEKKSILMDDI